MEELSEEVRRNIYAEFNATEDSIKKDVEYLMQWLQQQPHLPNVKGEVRYSIRYYKTKSFWKPIRTTYSAL